MMFRRSGLAFLLCLGTSALVSGCNRDDSSDSSGSGGGTVYGGTGGLAATGGSNGSGSGGSATTTGTGGASGVGGAGEGGSSGTAGGSGATGGHSGTGGASGATGGSSGVGGSKGTGGGASTGTGGSSSGTGGGSGMGGAGGGQVPFKGVANSPCADRTALNVSWYYNWEQTETEPCTGGKGGQFVPMIWGHTGSEQSASGISTSVASFVTKGYGYVLGFNEPDNTGQANIPVATAITLWPSFNNSAIQVGSPATSANSNGQTWFNTFITQVNASTTLHADFIAVHWYGWNTGSCDAAASQLNGYLNWVEGFAGNRPIWITEWGCLNDSAPDVQTVVNFYKGALAVFAKHPRLQRYAWYPWSTNLDLTNSDGSLTALGTAYAAAPAYK